MLDSRLPLIFCGSNRRVRVSSSVRVMVRVGVRVRVRVGDRVRRIMILPSEALEDRGGPKSPG
jgi:predicted SPOUT superfamily RNA methylase MTH1